MDKLSDESLVLAYKKAKEIELDVNFIQLLKKEITKRKILIRD
ncbi:sporulation histidine kinase inhibitor Sda [Siminovitchia fordii]|uniref:Sporulation histidine kinase inhibitor Sda n=2 Tax=Siminovitchia fordii TaxID=254759 RepID=A0ABQ4K5L9_9BACI|nr:hypothetical protein J1TS3_21610 [Siminovitchia fordii]